MHADFLVLYSKNYLCVTMLVHCSGKNLELVEKIIYHDVEKKVIKHFAEKSFSVFNRAPSDKLTVFFANIFYYFLLTFMKSVFCINSKY